MDLLLISIGVLIFLNIIVSIYLHKRDDLEKFQKVAQTLVVWMIPFVGAICMWLFNRSQDDNKPSGGFFGGGSASNSVDSAGSD